MDTIPKWTNWRPHCYPRFAVLPTPPSIIKTVHISRSKFSNCLNCRENSLFAVIFISKTCRLFFFFVCVLFLFAFSYMTIAAGIFIVLVGGTVVLISYPSWSLVVGMWWTVSQTTLFTIRNTKTHQRPPTQNAFRFIPVPPRFSTLFIFGRCRR